jgi:hypothetical protein
MEPMRDWIVILVLYVLNIALLSALGGLASAGEAFRRWGAFSSRLTRSGSSSPSA